MWQNIQKCEAHRQHVGGCEKVRANSQRPNAKKVNEKMTNIKENVALHSV